MTALLPWLRSQSLRLLPILLAIAVGFLVSGAIAAAVGLNPGLMFGALLRGAVEGPQFFETANRAASLTAMALCAAIPIRGGMVNLGGDGQLVLGGCASALVALYLPGPDLLRIVAALFVGPVVGGLYAALAALGEIHARVPMLVSTWLLSYPARGLCGWLVRGPFNDPMNAWPSTFKLPAGVRLTHLIVHTPITQGFVIIVAVAAMVVLYDRLTPGGYELRLRGLNERFARYGGVALGRQSVQVMFVSGAIAGLLGAVMVLGAQYRFTDGALTAPNYTWSGTLAALLAGGEPLGTIVAGTLFAALQTGGFAMERSFEIPRVLTMVLESVIILFLSMRGSPGRRRR